MKTVSEHIREHLLKTLNYPVEYEELLDETLEYLTPFVCLMVNRLLIGAIRYGRLKATKPDWDRMLSIRQRASDYDHLGNDELLVDIVNLAFLEYLEGTHPQKHFDSVDDGQHVEERG